MTAWGWRVPFLIGCLIVPFLFIIRRSLRETDEFLASKHRPSMGEIARSIAQNWGIVIAGMGMVIMTTVSFYMITAYTPTFGKEVLKLSADRCARRDGVRRPLESDLAAGDGRAVGPHRAPSGAARVHDSHHSDVVSGRCNGSSRIRRSRAC